MNYIDIYSMPISDQKFVLIGDENMAHIDKKTNYNFLPNFTHFKPI